MERFLALISRAEGEPGSAFGQGLGEWPRGAEHLKP